MNKSQVEDDIYHGDQAQALITNPAYQAALMRIKGRLFEQFGNSGILEWKKRKELWRMKRVVDQFESELNLMMQDAAIAKEDLRRSEKIQSIK